MLIVNSGLPKAGTKFFLDHVLNSSNCRLKVATECKSARGNGNLVFKPSCSWSWLGAYHVLYGHFPYDYRVDSVFKAVDECFINIRPLDDMLVSYVNHCYHHGFGPLDLRLDGAVEGVGSFWELPAHDGCHWVGEFLSAFSIRFILSWQLASQKYPEKLRFIQFEEVKKLPQVNDSRFQLTIGRRATNLRSASQIDGFDRDKWSEYAGSFMHTKFSQLPRFLQDNNEVRYVFGKN